MGRGEVVLGDDLGRKVLPVNLHVLVDCHETLTKKVFDITGAIPSPTVSVGDNAIEVQLGV